MVPPTGVPGRIVVEAWLREAGRKKAASQEAKAALSELRSFFKQCDAREKLREPEWAEHRAVIERSIQAARRAQPRSRREESPE